MTARFVYHSPDACPCRKKHRAADPPSKEKSSQEQKEAWRSDVCGACGSSLLCPTLQAGCAFCLPEGLTPIIESAP